MALEHAKEQALVGLDDDVRKVSVEVGAYCYWFSGFHGVVPPYLVLVRPSKSRVDGVEQIFGVRVRVNLRGLQGRMAEESLDDPRVCFPHHSRGESVSQHMRCHCLIESFLAGLEDDSFDRSHFQPFGGPWPGKGKLGMVRFVL